MQADVGQVRAARRDPAGNGETLTNGKGEKVRPRVGRLLFEVEGRPYWTMAWGDAQGASQRMRGLALMLIAQRQAKKAPPAASPNPRGVQDLD